MTILEPAVRSLSRRFEIVAKQTKVVGEVTDESGVYEVFVNGSEVRLGADGRFEKTVLLGYGDNQFTVTATDTKGNTAKATFTIVRQSGSSQNSPLLVGEGPGERSKDTTPPKIAIIEPAVRGTNRSIEVVERVKQTNIVVKATDEHRRQSDRRERCL